MRWFGMASGRFSIFVILIGKIYDIFDFVGHNKKKKTNLLVLSTILILKTNWNNLSGLRQPILSKVHFCARPPNIFSADWGDDSTGSHPPPPRIFFKRPGSITVVPKWWSVNKWCPRCFFFFLYFFYLQSIQ